jgi:TraC protein
MLEMLHRMGHRMTRLFGEPNIGQAGISYQKSKEIRDDLSGDFFAHLLPYEWFDEEHGIFINQNSLGFAIEIYPLAGCEEMHQREIDHLNGKDLMSSRMFLKK